MEEYEIKPDVSGEMLKERSSSLVFLVGGVFLTAMTIGARFPFVGIFLSGLAFAYGLGALMSKGREDKKRGLVMISAGLMGLLVRFGPAVTRPFAAFFLGLGAVGLLAAGIWSGVRYLILKSRL